MINIKIEYITDVQQLQECAALLATTYNAPPWNDEWTTEKALEKLTCFYNSPAFHGAMAFTDGKLVGCYIGNTEPYYAGDYYFLKEMFVSPAIQKKGIGSMLMQSLKAHLTEQGISTIILFTSSVYFPFQFYQKHRFDVMEGMCMMNYSI